MIAFCICFGFVSLTRAAVELWLIMASLQRVRQM
jgi:hypothetical protein